MAPKILAVDDDEALLGVMEAFFKAEEWSFRRAGSAKEGLRAASAERPDLILLDVSLPDGKGWDVCRRLRETSGLADIPILLISGQRKDSKDIVEGLRSGADDYIPKPIRFKVLIEKIKAILREPGA